MTIQELKEWALEQYAHNILGIYQLEQLQIESNNAALDGNDSCATIKHQLKNEKREMAIISHEKISSILKNIILVE